MEFNLADLFESIVDTCSDKPALVSEQRRLSYAELEARANRLANHLQSQGLGKDDHVGLQLRNGSEYIEGMLAAWKIRAVPININYNYTAAELAYIYDNADLKALVCHRQFLPQAGLAMRETPALTQLLYVEDGSDEPLAEHAQDYEKALASASAQRHFPPRSQDDLYIIYTGGTTGRPKGVMWHHVDIFFSAMGGGDPDYSQGPISKPEALVERLPDMEMAALPTPPFMHAAAQWLAMTTLFAGGKIVLPASGAFDVPAILKAIEAENVILLVVVGDAMAVPICDELEAHPDAYDVSSLFAMASGGALFSPATKDRVLKLLPGRMIVDGLGSSETGSMGSKLSAASGDSDEPRFMVNDAMIVLDDNDQPLAPGSGEVGRLAKKGHVPIGYYKAPEKSASTFVEIDGERWAIPGDMASVEADGTILLHGRGSTSINTGGEKVFPEEVEAALKTHPRIQDTLVVGLPDARWGEMVVALYQARDGVPLELDAVRDACRDQLAAYKLPRALVQVDTIKRTPAAKADYVWAKQEAARQLQPEAAAS